MADENITNISMHVCGSWVRRLFEGKLKWEELPGLRYFARRIQLNTHAQVHASTLGLFDAIRVHSSTQIIFQLDGVNDHLFDAAAFRHLNVAGLFDLSHGAGILPADWPFVWELHT